MRELSAVVDPRRPRRFRSTRPRSTAATRPERGPLPRWGGARSGAGRPPRHPISSQPHKRRPPLARGETVQIVARVVGAVGNLRRAAATAAIAHAIAKSRARSDFSILRTAIGRRRAPQLELLVEAADRSALARGMQGFQVTLARSLNFAARRRGKVFVDRYVARPIERTSRRPGRG